MACVWFSDIKWADIPRGTFHCWCLLLLLFLGFSDRILFTISWKMRKWNIFIVLESQSRRWLDKFLAENWYRFIISPRHWIPNIQACWNNSIISSNNLILLPSTYHLPSLSLLLSAWAANWNLVLSTVCIFLFFSFFSVFSLPERNAIIIINSSLMLHAVSFISSLLFTFLQALSSTSNNIFQYLNFHFFEPLLVGRVEY